MKDMTEGTSSEGPVGPSLFLFRKSNLLRRSRQSLRSAQILRALKGAT